MTERHISYEDLKDLCEWQQGRIRELENQLSLIDKMLDTAKNLISIHLK